MDQAISFCEGSISEEGVKTLLGTPDQGVIFEILEALGARQADKLLSCIASIAENNPNYFQLQESIMAVLHRVAIAQVLKDAIDNSEGDREQVLIAAGQFSAEEIQLYYQIALKGREDLVLASDHRMVFEMLLLRMLAFTPDGVPQSPTVPLLDQGPIRSGSDVDESDNDQQAADEKKKPKIAPPPPLVEEIVTAPHVQMSGEDKESLAQTRGPSQADSDASSASDSVEPEQGQITEVKPHEDNAIIGINEFHADNWLWVFEQIPVSGITRSVLANCIVEDVDGSCINLILDETQSSLYSEEHKARIQQGFAEYFAREINLQVRMGKIVTESPAGFSQRKKQEYIQQAIDDFEQDPNVKDVLEHFSARIQQGSIAPILK